MVAPTMGGMEVERRVVLAAETADAWAAVLDFSGWFCDTADVGEVKPGARVEFSWSDGTTRAAVFEEVDGPRFLAFRWLPFARLQDGEAVRRPQARVEITLSPVEGGIEMHVVERRMDVALTGARA